MTKIIAALIINKLNQILDYWQMTKEVFIKEAKDSRVDSKEDHLILFKFNLQFP
jgi:hypothetical protein